MNPSSCVLGHDRNGVVPQLRSLWVHGAIVGVCGHCGYMWSLEWNGMPGVYVGWLACNF